MSRIGRLPINVPAGVTVTVTPDSTVKVKGPKGELERKIESNFVTVEVNGSTVNVKRANDLKDNRALHGLYRTLINNMVVGVTEGYKKNLIVSGVGYKCAVNGSKLTMNIGFSHPVEMEAPQGIKVECPAVTEIAVSGIDKEAVGQFAAKIRAAKVCEPYHGYGIRYSDEVIIRKAGKTAGK